MIVGDHGNCDDMVQRNAEGNPQLDACGKALPKTCHSLDEVRIIYSNCIYSILDFKLFNFITIFVSCS